jgi:hypothetical protein
MLANGELPIAVCTTKARLVRLEMKVELELD